MWQDEYLNLRKSCDTSAITSRILTMEPDKVALKEFLTKRVADELEKKNVDLNSLKDPVTLKIDVGSVVQDDITLNEAGKMVVDIVNGKLSWIKRWLYTINTSVASFWNGQSKTYTIYVVVKNLF